MLPLMAEVSRTVCYRITDAGRDALASSLDGEQPPRSRAKNPSAKNSSTEELATIRRVLERLAPGEAVKVYTLRTATDAPPRVLASILASLVRKKWIARETSAVERDARRIERFVVLVPETRLPTLTAKQQAILAELAACNGELPLEEIRRKQLSPSSLCRRWCASGSSALKSVPRLFASAASSNSREPMRLNEPQTEALATIAAALGRFHAILLHGVTGSGKTAVYLAAMQRALDRGLASILLVPEIGLTPQMAGLLDAAFGERVALLHSALTPEERSEQWRRIHRGEAPIIVGTRSAIFAPVPNLGLICVDEEHDQSYKQEETPRYNARDVAVMRAKLAGAVVVLGSATPSLESWHNASAGQVHARSKCRDRVANRPLPEVELIDMRQRVPGDRRSDNIFSRVAHRADPRRARPRRAGPYSAQPPRLLLRRHLPRLRRKAGVPELRHRPHPPQAARRETGLARAGQRLECHYCGYRRTVPAALPQMRERTPLLPRRRLATGRGAA